MDTDTIDLLSLLRTLRKRLWIIVLMATLSVALAAGYTFFMVDEQYSADVLLYIWQSKKDSGTEDAISVGDLSLFSQLVGDYQVLAKSRLVTSQVAEDLGLDLSHADSLSSQITVGTKLNTRHLTITAVDTDPVMAANIANKVAEVFAAVVVEKMGAGNVNIIDAAVVPREPSSPNKPMNLALGLIIGIMIGIGLSLLIEMLDTSVKSAEEVEKLTGLTMLGSVPEFEHEPDLTGGKRHGKN